MPAVNGFADGEAQLYQSPGAGDGIPVDDAGTDEDSFEAESIQVADKVFVRKHTGTVLGVGKGGTIIISGAAGPGKESYTCSKTRRMTVSSPSGQASL